MQVKSRGAEIGKKGAFLTAASFNCVAIELQLADNDIEGNYASESEAVQSGHHELDYFEGLVCRAVC